MTLKNLKNFLLSFVVIGFTLLSSNSAQNICDNSENFEFLPSLSSCSEYYQCIDGISYLISCPRGLYFSPTQRRCMNYDDANCLIESTPTPVPPELCDGVPNFEFLPSQISCSEYFQCIDNFAFLLSCPRGMYFDIEISNCNYAQYVECYNGIRPTPPPPTTIPPPEVSCDGVPDATYLPSLTSCSEYFQCFNNEAFLVSCPRGMYFDVDLGTCNYSQYVECYNGVRPTPSPPISPPSTTPQPPPPPMCDRLPDFTFLPSLTSCSEYFQCIDNVAYLVSCPRGMYFDIELQMCNYSAYVECYNGIRPTPTPPSSPPPPPPPPSCNNIPDFGFIPSPSTCEEYYQCIDGTAFRLRCPVGLEFNIRIQSCDNPENFECIIWETSTVPSTSPPPVDVSCEGVEDFRLIAHPDFCWMFYECIDEFAFLSSCPVGRYFHELHQRCVDADDDVHCAPRDTSTRPTTTTPMPPIIDPQCIDVEEGRNVSNPFSCTSYYQCLEGRAVPRFCDDGLWFDEGLQRCDIPENTNCVVVTTTTSTIPTVPTDEPPNICRGREDNELVGSVSYCDRFYRCMNETAITERCDDGQWFDQIQLTCLPQNEVDCDLATLPPTTTSTPTPPEGICRGVTNATFVRSSQHCAEFFVCTNDIATRRMCPRGLWFNFSQQRCSLPYEANCQLDESFCDGIEDFGLNRFPGTCSDYFECIEGRPYAGSCWRSDLYFDEETQLCLPQDQVDCEYPPTEPPTSECSGVGDFRLAASWTDCSEYFICYDNEIFETLRCPDGQVFDAETQVCGDFECLL